MAVAATAVAEVRTAGSDTNGGGFNSAAAGTDHSQRDTKRTSGAGDTTDLSTTDAVANGTTTITSATANFQTSIVGNIIYLQGGTGSLARGWYQVNTRTNTTTITVDRTVAAGTGITMNIGGALATPGAAGAAVGGVAGTTVHVKAGTYTITSATQNTEGGCLNISSGTIIGYQTARYDRGTAPLLSASGISTFVVLSSTRRIENFTIDCNGLTSSRGVAITGDGRVNLVHVIDPTNDGINSTGSASRCYVVGHSGTFGIRGDGRFYECVVEDGTTTAFSTSGGLYINCVAINCSGASTDGFITNSSGSTYHGCASINNGRDGFRLGANVTLTDYYNCIAEGNAGWGIRIASTNAHMRVVNMGEYDNTLGFLGGTTVPETIQIYNQITGTGSFFVDAANGDFRLNAIAGQGAALRQAGYNSAFLGNGTLSYADIGPAQAQETANYKVAFIE